MDTQNPQIDIEEKEIPVEISDFVYSSKFSQKVDALAAAAALTYEQKKIVSDAVSSMMLEYITEDEALTDLFNLRLPSDKMLILMQGIQKDFIDFSFDVVVKKLEDDDRKRDIAELEKIVAENEKEESENTVPIEYMQNANPLASIANKMQGASVVAPIATVGQKFVPGGAGAPAAPTTARPSDPYREMPL